MFNRVVEVARFEVAFAYQLNQVRMIVTAAQDRLNIVVLVHGPLLRCQMGLLDERSCFVI